MRRAGTALVGVLGLLVLLVGCSSSAHPVRLSHDWSGVTGFELATIGGQRIVVGIDPRKGQARSLIRLPHRDDEDQVADPELVRGPHGSTLLFRPLASGRTEVDRLDAPSRSLVRRKVLGAGASLAAWTGGWAELDQDGTRTSIGGPDSKATLPFVADANAADNQGHLCVASHSEPGPDRGAVIDVRTGSVGPVRRLPARATLGCWDGRILTVVSGAQTGNDVPSISVARGALTRIIVSAGMIQSVTVDSGRVYVVDWLRGLDWVMVADLASGDAVRTVPVDQLGYVDDAYFSEGHLVLTSDNTYAILDPTTWTSRRFRIR